MNLSFPQMPDKLTSTEQDIVEYIAAHRDEFLCMTIGQLSARKQIGCPIYPKKVGLLQSKITAAPLRRSD